MHLNTNWKYSLLPGVSLLNQGCRLPLGHPWSVVPCSQILLLLWCDKFSWFCHLVLNNFQSSADDTSITSCLPIPKCPKTNVLLSLVMLQQRLGWDSWRWMVGDPEDSLSSCSIFLARPHSGAFLRECIQTNKLSSCTLSHEFGRTTRTILHPKGKKGLRTKIRS